MKPENFKRQTWTGIGIVALSMIVFGVVFYFLSDSIQKETTAIANGRNNILVQSALINSYSNLKDNAVAAASYQAAMDKVFATQDNLIAFPSQIDGIARNNGVNVVFSFQNNPVPSAAGTPGYVAFKLNVTGSLNGIAAFLKDVESSAPILLSKINGFDLTQSGSSYFLSADGRVFFK